MSQTLNPDSDVTLTNILSGSYTAIDETSPSDADFITTNNLSNGETAQYICGMSNPAGRPRAGLSTIRYRLASDIDAGISMQCFVLQGASIIASDTVRSPPASFTTYSFDADLSAITDWTDVRIAINFAGAHATLSPKGYIAFADIAAPDPARGGMMNMF